ncbi:hypothetical protein [Vagococcus fluvialis]|uniref:hypothetical protein n=1 Tax=Vagococcus fluvialis TaxID=2738 RepID=UPI002B29B9AF|nr:hypothetical protein QDW48_04650 [Vagococcus fluvialis]
MTVVDNYDYIENITRSIRGTTDINFQFKVRVVLEEYCREKNLKYEMPNSSGGDDKCDGWIENTGVFYQIYSPQQYRKSVGADIQSKFKTDLQGLLDIVCIQGKWGGQINEFIFLVNTFDRPLPHDSSRFFKTLVEEEEQKYKIKFEYRVVNVDYISDELLRDMSNDSLKFISSKLGIKGTIDYNAISLEAVYSVIDKISAKVHELIFIGNKDANYYKRISAPRKIVINNLVEYHERIEKIILNLGIIEDILRTINADMDYSNKFERVIKFIIDTYSELSEELDGVHLYDAIIHKISDACDNKESLKTPCEFLLVYVFDKCDIFEKE